MKHEEYFEKLSQVAVWQQEKTQQLSPSRRKQLEERLAAIKSDEDWQDNEESVAKVEELELRLAARKNWTLPIELVEVKNPPKPCEDCGKLVKDRKVNRRLMTTPITHWRTSCAHCKMTMNPETGKFTVNNKVIQSFFREYFSKRNK